MIIMIYNKTDDNKKKYCFYDHDTDDDDDTDDNDDTDNNVN